MTGEKLSSIYAVISPHIYGRAVYPVGSGKERGWRDCRFRPLQSLLFYGT